MFSKNIPPKVSSFSAVTVGYLLIGDLSANEQNALGNWLMLVAQVLCTNAYFVQLQNLDASKNNETEPIDINLLKRMKEVLEKEINNLEKK